MTTPLRRPSLTALIKELDGLGRDIEGVGAFWFDTDGAAHFRLSGFNGKGAIYVVCGLLDWMKADIVKDFIE